MFWFLREPFLFQHNRDSVGHVRTDNILPNFDSIDIQTKTYILDINDKTKELVNR